MADDRPHLEFLTAEGLTLLFGRSGRWLQRIRQRDPSFPRPLRVLGRLMWRTREVYQWIEAQAAQEVEK